MCVCCTCIYSHKTHQRVGFCMQTVTYTRVSKLLIPTYYIISLLIGIIINNYTSQIGENDDVANSSKFTRAPGVRRDFKYTKTFEENSNQEEIFETVARKIVDRFVDGYNGTVFAYGQTSTGKTYTVEGSARQYEERGLIPR